MTDTIARTKSIRIGCFNIANATRDEIHLPLRRRLPQVIHMIRQMDVDLLCLLEAGRPSGNESWTSLAARIESDTKLRYYGTTYPMPPVEGRHEPLGKAIFYDPTRVYIVQQKSWVLSDAACVANYEDWIETNLDNRTNGNGITQLFFGATREGRWDQNHVYNVAFVHFPMSLESRLQSAKHVNSKGDLFEFVLGDFNTFPDSGGPEMLEIMTGADEGQYTEVLPSDTTVTFRAFPHDTITLPKDTPLNADTLLVSTEDQSNIVRPASWLDHVLCSRRFNYKGQSIEAEVISQKKFLLTSVASDHDPVVLTFLCK